MILRLVPKSGPPVELDGPVVRVGRDTDCDLVLEDRSVSRLHAVIERTARGWSIKDQGSANGVFLDDHHITSAALEHGQTLRIGRVVFGVEIASVSDENTVMMNARELEERAKGAPAGPPLKTLWWAVGGLAAFIMVFSVALTGWLVYRDRMAARSPTPPLPAATIPGATPPPTTVSAPIAVNAPAAAPAPPSPPPTSATMPAATATEPARASPSAPLAGATLLLASDQECELRIDGKPAGHLSPDAVRAIAVAQGEHLVTAFSADGRQRWEQIVTTRGPEQVVVRIQLTAPRGPVRAADAAPPATAPPAKATVAETPRPVTTPPPSPLPAPKTPEPRRVETETATRPPPAAREPEPARVPPVTLPPATLPPAPTAESEELALAIRQIDDRAYDAALGHCDAVARRLMADGRRPAEAAEAKLFAGVALLGMGQQEAAKSRFRDALALGGANLRLDPIRFNKPSRHLAEEAAKLLETVRP